MTSSASKPTHPKASKQPRSSPSGFRRRANGIGDRQLRTNRTNVTRRQFNARRISTRKRPPNNGERGSPVNRCPGRDTRAFGSNFGRESPVLLPSSAPSRGIHVYNIRASSMMRTDGLEPCVTYAPVERSGTEHRKSRRGIAPVLLRLASQAKRPRLRAP